MNITQAKEKMRYIITENQELKDSNDRLKKELENMQKERDAYREHFEMINNAAFWKITYPMRAALSAAGRLASGAGYMAQSYAALVKKVPYSVKNRGLYNTLIRVVTRGRSAAAAAKKNARVSVRAKEEDTWTELLERLEHTPHNFIDIFGVPMGWNTPLFQRFQHISMQVGKAGGISFYGAHPAVDKDVETYQFITPYLCLVNLENAQSRRRFFEIMDDRQELKYIRVQSIDLATSIDDLERYMQKGYEIVYEYIDELSPQITGQIPDFVLKRHEYILRNEDIIAVATSDKLFAQMKPYRSRNMAMICNGADYQHWNVKKEDLECPEELQEAVNSGKWIVGYHGALASWVDFQLLADIASDGRYLLLLIGHEHDANMRKSGILDMENVLFLGAKPYRELNRYAAFYDVAILPFRISDLTLSVSPVKIFEYMALEKPIVTSALPECKKYSSCLCAGTPQEFMEKLEQAVQLKEDAAYKEQLRTDALNHTWDAVAKETAELVKEHHRNKAVRSVKTRQRTGMQKTGNVQESMLHAAYTQKEMRAYISEILKIPSRRRAESYRELADTPFVRKENSTKIIAYYLTQFHPDPHNEIWWGKGVTEWDNVSRAVPQFIGHYQPRFPGELGYYDLRIEDQMKRQVELAKWYGIYGFSFYYYWFNGERLLEAPLEMFLAHTEISFPFSLCWANENWTRRFDGTNSDVLMEQPVSEKSYKNVIADMIRFLTDSRYITIAGKKLVTVYRPSLMPRVKEVLKYWRKYCLEHGAGELYLIAVKEHTIERDWLKEGYDAVSEFHPGTLYAYCKNITDQIHTVRKDFAGEIFSYEDIVREKKYFQYDYPKLYRAVMPMWDNTARRNHKGMIFHGSTPKLYKQWLKDVVKECGERTDLEERMVFLNAWNEWGEGAYMEPDKRYGYAYLAATREVLEEEIKDAAR